MAALAAPAHAAPELAMQDDPPVMGLSPTDWTLIPWVKANAPAVRWVRMNAKSNHNLDYVDLGIDRVRAAGMRPQLTVWAGAPGENPFYPKRNPTPAEAAAWATKVATRFKDEVDRYSIQNEPDIFTVQEGSCDSATVVQAMRDAGLKPITTYKVRYKKKKVRRKRYRKRWVYRYRQDHGRTIKVKVKRRVKYYKRVKKKIRIKKKRTRWVPISATTSVRKTVTPERGCAMIRYARTYRSIYEAEYAAIKRIDPSAQVLIGETSPRPEATVFISELGRTGSNLVADGYAHHTYQESDPNYPDPNRLGIGRLDVLREMLDDGAARGTLRTPQGRSLPIYITEMGWGPGYGEVTRPDWLRKAYRKACAADAKQFLWYGWTSSTARWNSMILRGPSHGRTPTFETFRSLKC
jgi:hypothetical protein